MVMSRKDSHQSLRLDQGFHKAVIAMVVAVSASTVVLVADKLGVNAWFCVVAATTRLLESASGLNGDVDESKTGNDSTILLVELVTCVLEP